MLAEFNGYTMEATTDTTADSSWRLMLDGLDMFLGKILGPGVGSIFWIPNYWIIENLDILWGEQNQQLEAPGHPHVLALGSNQAQHLLLLVVAWRPTIYFQRGKTHGFILGMCNQKRGNKDGEKYCKMFK